MCTVQPEDRIFGEELRPRLECLQDRRLQWFGHLEKMEESSSWSSKCRTFGVIRNVLKERKVSKNIAKDRNLRKSFMRDRPIHTSMENRH